MPKEQEHHCLAVVISTPETPEDTWVWFYSTAEVAKYIGGLPLAWNYKVQIFCDKQHPDKITKLGQEVELSYIDKEYIAALLRMPKLP